MLSQATTVLLIGTALIVGYYAGGGHGPRPLWSTAFAAPGTLGKPTLDDRIDLRPVTIYQEALTKLQNEYVEPIKDPAQLTYGAIRGMLSVVNDPYTRFMDPKEFKEFNSDNAGRFAGIGATLSLTEVGGDEKKDGEGTRAPQQCPVCGTVIGVAKYYRVSVVEPLPNSPAKGAGVQAGDVIMKVDTTVTDGMTVSEVADKIRGPEGTKVTLTLARKGIEKPVVIPITRAEIEVPATEKKILDDNIGYLRLFQFNEKTAGETSEALKAFNKANVRGVVLDLRNNPGGLLTECVRIASMLLPNENKVVVYTMDRSKERENYTHTGPQIYSKPLVVLVNKGSASASEILSGALKDYKRATVVGESTFGKALVQTVLRLSDGSAMAVTTAHYYTPQGHDVGKVGVAPNVAVELDKDAKKTDEKDNQAQEAIRLLKQAIAKVDAAD
jgi:carboxyl-terminal processing protease